MDEKAKKIVDALQAKCIYNSDNDDGRTCNDCPRLYYCHDKDYDIEGDAADLIERLSAELEQVKCERDAAIRDARIGGHCLKCKFNEIAPEEEPCNNCSYACGDLDNWQWRGVCAENSKENIK